MGSNISPNFRLYSEDSNNQPMVNGWFGCWWFKFLAFPYERSCYLGVLLGVRKNHGDLVSPTNEIFSIQPLDRVQQEDFGGPFGTPLLAGKSHPPPQKKNNVDLRNQNDVHPVFVGSFA